jgi:hypothetical protein
MRILFLCYDPEGSRRSSKSIRISMTMRFDFYNHQFGNQGLTGVMRFEFKDIVRAAPDGNYEDKK